MCLKYTTQSKASLHYIYNHLVLRLCGRECILIPSTYTLSGDAKMSYLLIYSVELRTLCLSFFSIYFTLHLWDSSLDLFILINSKLSSSENQSYTYYSRRNCPCGTRFSARDSFSNEDSDGQESISWLGEARWTYAKKNCNMFTSSGTVFYKCKTRIISLHVFNWIILYFYQFPWRIWHLFITVNKNTNSNIHVVNRYPKNIDNMYTNQNVWLTFSYVFTDLYMCVLHTAQMYRIVNIPNYHLFLIRSLWQ